MSKNNIEKVKLYKYWKWLCTSSSSGIDAARGNPSPIRAIHVMNSILEASKSGSFVENELTDCFSKRLAEF